MELSSPHDSALLKALDEAIEKLYTERNKVTAHARLKDPPDEGDMRLAEAVQAKINDKCVQRRKVLDDMRKKQMGTLPNSIDDMFRRPRRKLTLDALV